MARALRLRVGGTVACRLALSASLCASPAGAASLIWQADEACPTAADVRFAMERMLGIPLERARPARLLVAVSQRPDSRFVASVWISEEPPGRTPTTSAERTLIEDDCWTLAAAVEAVLVLAIGGGESSGRDPSASLAAPSRQAEVDTGLGPQVEASALPLAAAPIETVTPRADEELHLGEPGSRAEPPSFAISGWLVGNGGALPEPAIGFELALASRFDTMEVRASLEFLPAQALSVAAREVELTGELDALTSSGLVCTEPRSSGSHAGAVDLSLCAGWSLARWSGSGSSVSSAWWTGPRAEVGVAWPLPGLDGVRFGVRAGGLLALRRPGVYLESERGRGLAYQLPAVVGSMLAGFEMVLP